MTAVSETTHGQGFEQLSCSTEPESRQQVSFARKGRADEFEEAWRRQLRQQEEGFQGPETGTGA